MREHGVLAKNHTHTLTDGDSLKAQPGQLKRALQEVAAWSNSETHTHSHTHSGPTQGHTDGRCYTNTSHWSIPYYQLSQSAS